MDNQETFATLGI